MLLERETERPCLLLAYVDSAHASRTARSFRRQGWEVHLAASGLEVYQKVHDYRPQTVILDTELGDESGWLVAAKLHLAGFEGEIALLTPNTSADLHRRAREVGASLVVNRSECAEVLEEEMRGRTAPQLQLV